MAVIVGTPSTGDSFESQADALLARLVPSLGATMPGWVSAIDEFTATKCSEFRVLPSAVHPEYLGLTVAAAAMVRPIRLVDHPG